MHTPRLFVSLFATLGRLRPEMSRDLLLPCWDLTGASRIGLPGTIPSFGRFLFVPVMTSDRRDEPSQRAWNIWS